MSESLQDIPDLLYPPEGSKWITQQIETKMIAINCLCGEHTPLLQLAHKRQEWLSTCIKTQEAGDNFLSAVASGILYSGFPKI